MPLDPGSGVRGAGVPVSANELWWARVGGDVTAHGSPVAVVVCDGPGDVAAWTDALAPAPVVALERASGELRWWGTGPRPPLGGLLAARAVAAWRDAPPGGSARVEVRLAPAERLEAPLAPLTAVCGHLRGVSPPRVDPGARSLIQELNDAASLELVYLEPRALSRYLRSEGLRELCLFARGRGAGRLSARSFADTGQERRDLTAAAPALWRALEPTARATVWELRQGSGPARRRALLHLAAGPTGDRGGGPGADRDELRVAASVRLIGRGVLLDEPQRAAPGRVA